MALPSRQLDIARQGCARDLKGVATDGAKTGMRGSKTTINAALNAVDDLWRTSWRAAASTAIDTATSPTVLTNDEKKAIRKHWLQARAGRE